MPQFQKKAEPHKVASSSSKFIENRNKRKALSVNKPKKFQDMIMTSDAESTIYNHSTISGVQSQANLKSKFNQNQNNQRLRANSGKPRKIGKNWKMKKFTGVQSKIRDQIRMDKLKHRAKVEGVDLGQLENQQSSARGGMEVVDYLTEGTLDHQTGTVSHSSNRGLIFTNSSLNQAMVSQRQKQFVGHPQQMQYLTDVSQIQHTDRTNRIDDLRLNSIGQGLNYQYNQPALNSSRSEKVLSQRRFAVQKIEEHPEQMQEYQNSRLPFKPGISSIKKDQFLRTDQLVEGTSLEISREDDRGYNRNTYDNETLSKSGTGVLDIASNILDSQILNKFQKNQFSSAEKEPSEHHYSQEDFYKHTKKREESAPEDHPLAVQNEYQYKDHYERVSLDSDQNDLQASNIYPKGKEEIEKFHIITNLENHRRQQQFDHSLEAVSRPSTQFSKFEPDEEMKSIFPLNPRLFSEGVQQAQQPRLCLGLGKLQHQSGHVFLQLFQDHL
jgi:hypothetical protein